MAAITNNLQSIEIQLNKLNKYCHWAGMDLEVPKCVIIGCPNKSKTKPETFKAKIQAQNINYKNQQIPILHQNEPYVYLDILLVPGRQYFTPTSVTRSRFGCQLRWVHFSGPPRFGPLMIFWFFFC